MILRHSKINLEKKYIIIYFIKQLFFIIKKSIWYNDIIHQILYVLLHKIMINIK